jgi:Holliday junction resolvase RusA-like endonuclease
MSAAAPEPVARFSIPVPPSTNNLYVPRRDGKGRAKTSAYAAWQREAGQLVTLQCQRRTQPLKHVRVEIGAPFSYRRDIDNVKPVLDLLTWMGVIVDDRWVDELEVKRIAKDGPMSVALWRLT